MHTAGSVQGRPDATSTADNSRSVIYRYKIDVTADSLELPYEHELLSIAPARDGYYIDLWARVTPDTKPVTREIAVYGTGHPISDPWRSFGTGLTFLGTAVMSDGLVWHVFAGSVVADL